MIWNFVLIIMFGAMCCVGAFFTFLFLFGLGDFLLVWPPTWFKYLCACHLVVFGLDVLLVFCVPAVLCVGCLHFCPLMALVFVGYVALQCVLFDFVFYYGCDFVLNFEFLFVF